jgi:secreted PhoX family phosphatase
MGDDNFSNKDEAFQAFDDIPLSPADDDTMGAVIARRYGRRDILKGSLAVTAATALFGTAALQSASGPAKAATAGFAFRELEAGVDETHHVAEGYVADVVIRWGDPLAKDMQPFDPRTLTGEEQSQAVRLQQRLHRLLPARRQQHARSSVRQQRVRQPRGDVPRHRRDARPHDFAKITETHVAVEMAAHGVSIVESRARGRQMAPVSAANTIAASRPARR